MRATFFLLKRYLLPHEGSLLTLALWIAVAGVALGIIQLMVVLSVMTGFQKFLKDSYTRITSEMVVIPRASSLTDDEIAQRVASFPGIEAITPFAFGQAMVVKNGVGGVTLEGIDFEKSKAVTPWKQIWVTPPAQGSTQPNGNWMWIGVQLANKLKVKVGDTVNVFVPGNNKRVFPFTITAITKFGIYEHDMRYAYLSLNVLKKLFEPEPLQTLYKVALSGSVPLDVEVDRMDKSMGDFIRIKKWSEINQNLFRAVQHQKWMLFAILEIIIGLAAMNVVNLLMMSSHHRRRDIAILRAMGMRLFHVVSFFVVQGAAVGMVGIASGIVAGLGVCSLIERFQPTLLSEKVYNVTRLPIKVDLRDVVSISIGAFVVCVVFSVLPAIKAAMARPVNALRQEL